MLFFNASILNMSFEIWSTGLNAFEEINEESDNLAEEEDAAEFFDEQIVCAKAAQHFNFSSAKAIEKENLFRTENYFEVHSPPPEFC